uniref:Putative ovule protein n=1 Tax=Solanum chacoense TaxID=4108 RepID=A0A0V0GXF9_SOLCH
MKLHSLLSRTIICEQSSKINTLFAPIVASSEFNDTSYSLTKSLGFDSICALPHASPCNQRRMQLHSQLSQNGRARVCACRNFENMQLYTLLSPIVAISEFNHTS